MQRENQASPVLPMRDEEKALYRKQIVWLGLALLCGLIGEGLFAGDGKLGVSVPLFTLACYGVFLWTHRPRLQLQLNISMLLSGTVLLVSCSYVLRDFSLFYIVNLLALPALFVIHTVWVTGDGKIPWHHPLFLGRVVEYAVGRTLLCLPVPVRAALKAGRRRVEGGDGSNRTLVRIGLGLLLALPLLLVAGALLSSADDLFQRAMGRIPEWLEGVPVGETAGRAIRVILFGLFLTAFLWGLRGEPVGKRPASPSGQAVPGAAVPDRDPETEWRRREEEKPILDSRPLPEQGRAEGAADTDAAGGMEGKPESTAVGQEDQPNDRSQEDKLLITSQLSAEQGPAEGAEKAAVNESAGSAAGAEGISRQGEQQESKPQSLPAISVQPNPRAIGASPSPSRAAALIHLDPVVATTFLTAMNAMYVLFAAIQLSYLFAGGDGLLPSNITYAQYARKGFFELVMVTILNLGVLLLCIRLIPQGVSKLLRVVHGLQSLLIGCTLVMLVSAFYRLLMYESAYGFTVTRVLVHSFMLYLAVILLLVLVRIWRTRSPLWKQLLVVSISAYAMMNLLNIDAIIVRENGKRYDQTGRIDLNYLSSLSADGIPELLQLYDRLPEGTKQELAERLQSKKVMSGADHRWTSFSFSRHIAERELIERGFSGAGRQSKERLVE
ncbi:DUF4153 domain-containing protein [Paenibacillus sp. y28]|uniref:DUF4153 domain-containing protein n=1 Tax=Paenibacillus sp. y28 TaxID=3129110 RepID=UPI00301B06DF